MEKLIQTGVPLRKALAMGLDKGMYGKSKKPKPAKTAKGRRKMRRRQLSKRY